MTNGGEPGDVPVIAISALEHHAYCPRQCALIHVDGLWDDNEHTVRGQRGHRRVDEPRSSRHERGRSVVRALTLWSEALGLTGRADAVEVLPDGTLVPVEYKVGSRHGHAADIQLCAQALCLEEMFHRPVAEGAIWFSGPRRRVKVAIDEDLRRLTRDAVHAVRRSLLSTVLPVAVNDARCEHCQLRDVCLPELTAAPGAVADYVGTVLWNGS